MRPYKYWRITSIVTSALPDAYVEKYLSITELNFINDKTLPCNTTSKVIFNNDYTHVSSPTLSFDNNFNTSSKTKNDNNLFPFLNYWVGYEFDEPVVVNSIELNLDLSQSYYMEVRQAKVQASDDKNTWVDVGWIYPFYSQSSLRKYTIFYKEKSQNVNTRIINRSGAVRVKTQKPLIYKNSINGIPINFLSTIYLSNNYRNEYAGYIRGTVYESINGVKTPVVRKVYLYNQITGNLVSSTWSNKDGTYLFIKLSLQSTFMIVSIDHNKKFGLEGVAFKQAKEVVINGLQLSYPITD